MSIFTTKTDINGLIIGYPPASGEEGIQLSEAEVDETMLLKFPHVINGQIVEQPEEDQFYINEEWVDKSGFSPDFEGGFASLNQVQTINWSQPSTSTDFVIPLGQTDINAAQTRMTVFSSLPSDATQMYTFSNGVEVIFNKADWDDLVQKVHALLNP